MNIVFFTRLFHPHIGGVEKHVLRIGEILSQKHTVTIVTEQYDKTLPLEEEFSGMKIFRIPLGSDKKKKKYEIWDYLFNKRSIITSSDIIHIHDVFFWYLPFRFMYPSKRVFMTFHGYEGDSLPSFRAILSHKIGEILTSGNICVGDFLSKWYHTKPTIVTYGAIDRVKKRSEIPSFTQKKKVQVLYIGRLEKEAGIMEYLKLVRKLTADGYALSLTVLGDGSQRKSAHAYVTKHNLPVTFLGFVHHVEEYIPKSDIVFTSRYLGVLEAMVHKKPVLAIYNNAIKKDYFEMSPFKDSMYVGGSVSQLYNEYLQIITDNKGMQQRVKDAYSFVKNKTWKNMVTIYCLLWNDGKK